MKRSIKRQMIILFTGLIVCVFMVLFVVNVKFLGPYYIQNKETEFVEMYERLDDALLNGTIDRHAVLIPVIGRISHFPRRHTLNDLPVQAHNKVAARLRNMSIF